MAKQKIFGRHAVAELLDSGLEVMEVFIIAGGQGKAVMELKSAVRSHGIRLVPASRAELDRLAPEVNHQGVVAYYRQPRLLNVEEVLDSVQQDPPRPVLIIDGVEDPHNLGAIIRSAEVLGAGGVIFRKPRAAGLTPLAVKASAGAALWLPIASVTNIDQTIRLMKDRDYWIYGLDADAEESIWDAKLSGSIGFVLGAEGKGLSRLVRKRCDKLLRIPQFGKVASLNVSVSASLALGEWLRQSMRKMVQGLDLSSEK
ncbi:23S rRNA (guanosine(2251)-2'-O)-methyltransferase RlmB [bacterium]|nr:23S rRNA (guanosine(2251)-2'-O)-methyltransferase RlmB [bacterium]